MNQFKAALFDLDGTLVETERQYTVFWGETGRKYRPDVPDLAYAIKGTTLTQIFSRYFPDPEWQRDITAALDAWERQMDYEFIPGALDFLRDIRRHGVRTAVVTSSNQKKMSVVSKRLPELTRLIDRILTSEDFRASKPDPDCYITAARVLGFDRAECAVFEDAFTGLDAGRASGIFTVGLTTYNSRELIQDRCDHVIPDFRGLTFDDVNRLLLSKRNPN